MPGAKRRILLVDDSKEDRFLLMQALAEAGLDCEIDEACDGEEAELYLFRKMNEGGLPQLVILDLLLPKLSGRELMEKLCGAGLDKLTKVVFLSSILPDEERARLQEMGAWRVFEKPMDLTGFSALGKFVKEYGVAETLSAAQAG
jgi:DNA-binding response OmpR family regulator